MIFSVECILPYRIWLKNIGKKEKERKKNPHKFKEQHLISDKGGLRFLFAFWPVFAFYMRHSLDK